MGLKVGLEGLPSFDGWQRDLMGDYRGSDRKMGLIRPDGARFMVKFSEKTAPVTILLRAMSITLCPNMYPAMSLVFWDTPSMIQNLGLSMGWLWLPAGTSFPLMVS